MEAITMPIKHTIKSRDGGTRTVNLTPIKAVRFHCVDECAGTAREVKRCTSQLCPLYPYRLGSNPERSGIGGKKAKKANLSRVF
jgi:hypothetical protein